MEDQSITFNLSLINKFKYCLFALIGFPFFIVLTSLSFINVNKPNNSNEIELLNTLINYTYIIFSVLIILSTLIWHIKSKTHQLNNKLIVYYCVTLCRLLLASIIINYGFQKLLVDQLHASYYWYGDELGDLSGFQLTWSFFGYSKIYCNTIAVAQIFGGIALLFRRTTLLGALFLLPILTNIALIDFNYDITAKDIISVLLLMDLFLISLSFNSLFSFFVRNKIENGANCILPYSSEKKIKIKSQLALVFLIICLGFVANYNQIKVKNKTKFEGYWKAMSVQNFTDSIPEKNNKLILKLFIDGNIATVKKTYQYEDYNINYDASKSKLILSKTNDSLLKNNIIGNYKFITNDSLLFIGKDGKDSIRWVLKRTSKN